MLPISGDKCVRRGRPKLGPQSKILGPNIGNQAHRGQNFRTNVDLVNKNTQVDIKERTSARNEQNNITTTQINESETDNTHKEPQIIHKEPRDIHKEPQVIHKEPQVIQSTGTDRNVLPSLNAAVDREYSNQNTIPVEINSNTFIALVDSGAQISCMSNEAFTKSGLSKKETHHKTDLPFVKGVDGTMVNIICKIKTAVKIGHLDVEQWFYILEKNESFGYLRHKLPT